VIYFRIRDYVSVLFYRTLKPFFGKLGSGSRIIRPLRIVGARYMYVEANATIQVGAYVAVLKTHTQPPELRIGEGAMIGNHAHIICTRRIVVGRQALIADRVYISDNSHEYTNISRPILAQGLRQLADVEIGDGAWIGENVCIIGSRIGRNSVVGANSVVVRDIPDHCVATGAPAAIIKRYCHDTNSWQRTDAAGNFLP
jgi:acetyltransferase-like isoleucine patch superfamily enzyme